MRILVATAVMVTAGASQRGDMSDEEVVTYPIDDVLAVLEHVEHMTLEQIEARIMEIEAEEMPPPWRWWSSRSSSWRRCISGNSTCKPGRSCRTMGFKPGHLVLKLI